MAIARRAKSSARSVALRVIRRVTEEGAYSNLALSRELDRSALPARDRHFAAELAYGTLRKRIPLDHRIAAASARAIERIDPDALALLRLGGYQLDYTRVPPHAAVSETVDLAPPPSRGFVNAVLRSMARSMGTGPSPRPSEGPQAISLATGLTAWAVAELGRVLPDDEVAPAASALASHADLSLRSNPCAGPRAELVERLRRARYEVEPGRWDPDALRLPAGPPSSLPGFDQGWFAVQDEASTLVVRALDPRRGERILDACAGPGGKAAHIACLVQPGGVAVGAEVSVRRTALVAASAARLRVPVRALVQDARHPALTPGSFDAALVDAPCSGLGAARRRPELLWRPSKDGLSRLARLQVSILAAVVDLVRPGGRLVYSVCTFPRAETDAVVRAILAKRSDLEPMDVAGPDGVATTHRLWPHRHGTDAMFYAAFHRAQSSEG